MYGGVGHLRAQQRLVGRLEGALVVGRLRAPLEHLVGAVAVEQERAGLFQRQRGMREDLCHLREKQGRRGCRRWEVI